MNVTKNTVGVYQYIENDIRGNLAFDIGAAKGVVTRTLLNMGADVVAIEPQKGRIKEKNIDGVKAFVNKGVSDKEQKLVFYKCKSAPNISTVDVAWTKGKHRKNTKWEKITINCTTIDKLIEEFGLPFYVKIDVENYEGVVLSGLTSSPNMISFEYTGGFLENFKLCMDRVGELGYARFLAFEKHKVMVDGKQVGIVDIYEFENIEEILEYYNGLKFLQQGDLLVIM